MPVPKALEGGKSFDFLRRDLRRTGLGGAPGTPGGGLGSGPGGGHFDSSLHGGGYGSISPGLPPGSAHSAHSSGSSGAPGGFPGHLSAG